MGQQQSQGPEMMAQPVHRETRRVSRRASRRESRRESRRASGAASERAAAVPEAIRVEARVGDTAVLVAVTADAGEVAGTARPAVEDDRAVQVVNDEDKHALNEGGLVVNAQMDKEAEENEHGEESEDDIPVAGTVPKRKSSNKKLKEIFAKGKAQAEQLVPGAKMKLWLPEYPPGAKTGIDWRVRLRATAEPVSVVSANEDNTYNVEVNGKVKPELKYNIPEFLLRSPDEVMDENSWFQPGVRVFCGYNKGVKQGLSLVRKGKIVNRVEDEEGHALVDIRFDDRPTKVETGIPVEEVGLDWERYDSLPRPLRPQS